MSISTRFERLARLRGWRALLSCFGCGALFTFALAPFGVWPVIFISLPIFYLFLEAAPDTRRACLRSFFFGYGFFMAGTWWIANAMLVDVAKFGWMIPVSILGLSAWFALWFIPFGALVHKLRSAHRVTNILRFSLIWVAIEYLRSLGEVGFPWNLAGYVALDSLSVAQMASLIGTFGLSFFVIGIGLSPILLLHNQPRLIRRAGILVPVLLIAAAYGYGAARVPGPVALTPVRLRIVQPNIPQTLKWTAEGKLQSLQMHAQLSRVPGPVPDMVIWSESAFPFALWAGSDWPKRLAPVIPPNGMLFTGAVREEGSFDAPQIWNSLVAIDSTGALRAMYGKHQLVPFGEFVPLRAILPVDKITPGNVDFSRGEGVTTWSLGPLPPMSPLVCYEIIFPWIVADPAHRPQWLLNVTNDGWYGNSPGPYQHFAMARMRAIEQGLPLVRAANTGISAVVDPYGRVLQKLPLGERGVIDARLPGALAPTLYARYGEKVAWLLLAVLALVAFMPRSLYKNK